MKNSKLNIDDLLEQLKADKHELVESARAYQQKLRNKFTLPVLLVAGTVASAFLTRWIIRKKKPDALLPATAAPTPSPLVAGLLASVGLLLPKLLLNLYDQNRTRQ